MGVRIIVMQLFHYLHLHTVKTGTAWAYKSDDFKALIDNGVIGDSTHILKWRDVPVYTLYKTIGVQRLVSKFNTTEISIIVTFEDEQGEIYQAYANNMVASKLIGGFQNLAEGQGSYWMSGGQSEKDQKGNFSYILYIKSD